MTSESVQPEQPEQPEQPQQPAHLDPDTFAAYLVRTRWFGGKGRPYEVTGVRAVGEVPGGVEDSPWVVVHLVDVDYADVPEDAADRRETYHVPLALYTNPETRLDHAFVGWWEDPERGWVHAYDAVHDREAMDCWLRSFDAATSTDDLSFRRLPGYQLDTDTHSTLFSGEQSNSSVAFGEDSLLKVFRKVTPGANPDITVHRVLTEAGSAHVATLYGWVEAPGPDGGSSYDLGMLQQFLRTATDGWDLALSSVRTLFTDVDTDMDADAEIAVEESGGDFSGEAARLGESLQEVHAMLAGLGAATIGGAALAAVMSARLDSAARAVPDLVPHVPHLREVFARVAALGDVAVQQIHGDLHLGQTLRTSLGWKLVDFEGEPAKTLAERLEPDSPWRDVAGMLRSFDYAPRVVERSQEVVDETGSSPVSRAAEAWAQRAGTAFLEAYAGGPLTDEQRVLVDAYIADKAIYETVYEARNRPTWVSIPLAAIARIGT